MSLANTGGVDVDYIAKLLNKKKPEVLKSLDGLIYENPLTNGFETADEYLSGNVREKLEYAKLAAAENSRFAKNIKALENVQPADLIPEEISVNLGTPWIPSNDIVNFANYMLETGFAPLTVSYNSTIGSWAVSWDNDWRARNAKDSVNSRTKWGTHRRDFADILEDALNMRSPVVYDTLEDGKRRVNQDETTKAQAKIKEVQDEFKKWVWTDKERAERLAAYYNRNYNNWRLREYDGSHLTFPGYSTLEPSLKPHQKAGVWRIMQGYNTLLAHCVGAGKTWTMQTAAMEMKRLGIANKSMFVIPNHMLKQFENEFRRIYPNAKLLTISSETLPDVTVPNSKKLSKEELEKRRTAKNAQRQNILGRIATEDWDGIIISHNMFKRIPMSPEAYNRFYEEQIEEMRNAIIELSVTGDKKNRSNNRLVKDLEKRAKNLEEKLKRNMNEESKDIVIPFEQLGIDQIFVDEADMFKNLYFTTKMNRIAGISNTNSQRSTDMFMKTQYLTKLNNGRGVVFATGTPISNTMAEMFTMLRYLDAANLREKNMSFFDNWAANFAVKETTVERSPDGQGYRQTEKFTSFTNMPELIKMFRKVADVKTQEDLNLDIPKLKNNKPTVIEVEPNDALRNFIKYEIRDRAKAIHDRAVDPTEDNMLKLTSDLRKASLDIRLVDSSVPAQIADGKITAVADNVFKKYNETKDIKGVQLVFCDLSTPKGASDKIVESDTEMDSTPEVAEENINVTAYEEIKKKLVKSGVPSQEIAFIHDVKTKERKEALFAKVRSGEVRVLIGSTEKMGAGTNIQDRLVALHHIDAPWRPRDIEQREGRILRQGNMNKEVEIFTYVTKDSFDANMWEKLKNKATMINQAMSNNLSNRIIEDMDATVLSFAEVEALASGNPLMAERTMVMAELNKYETLYASYRKEKARLENRAGYLPKAIERAKEANSNANKDIKQREDISGDNFSITIGRKTYDNRTDAKTPFDRLVKGFNNEVGAVIGSIGGFELKLRLIKAGNTFTYAGRTYVAENNTVRAEVVGKNTYGCEAKLGSVEYAVMHAPDKEATNSENVIQSLQNELKAVQKELKAPFQYEEKYQTLRKRAEEIEEIFANGEANDEQKTKYSLTNEEDSRSIEEIVTEISDAIGDDVKKVEPYGKRSILVTLLNNKRVVVKIEDEIILTPEEMSQAKKDHGFDDDADGIIHGYWEKVTSDDIDGILSISRKSTKGTAYHEVLHMAMDLALTQRERNALWKDAEKEAKATGVETEEVIAERYRKWVLARKSGGGTAFGKLLQKMQDFWHQMKALLTGVENAYNVMRKLESAEVWTRNGKRVVGKKGRKLLIAYHGSPNKFDKFSKDYIGTGEGAQAHGWGLYFAEEKKVAEGYRSKLIKGYYDADEIPITLVVDGVTYYTDDGMWENKTSKEWVEMESAQEIFLTKLAQNEGNLQYTIKELDAERAAFNEDETKGYTDNELEEAYQMAKVAKDVSYSREVSEGSLHTVDIPEVNVMLDEEKRFNEQPEVVREAIMSIFDGNENPHYSDVFDGRTKGETIYEIISDTVGGDKEASETLNSLGVKGITYNGMIDGRCYVVFDDEAIKILGDSKTAGKKKALVTNNAITGETRVPVVDVTNLPKLDTSIGAVKAAIARNLVGKTFRIIGSNGIGRVANMTDGRHLVGSSQKMQRHYAIRKQAMSAIEEVLNNAVYIEKHTDTRHGTASKYIELYAVVKNKNDLTRFRIVAKEGDKNAGEYEVKDAKFYDIIKDGAVTANMFKNILPAQRSKDLQGQVAQNVPSAISVAELLTGVKDADGKPYVKADGSLAYEASAKKYSFAHSKKMTLEEKVRRATVSSNPQSLTDEIKKNGIKGYLKAKKDEFYKDWIDKNDSLHGLDDAVKLGLGRELKGSEKIYDKVQDLPARAAGMAEALLEGNGQNVAAINRRLQNKKLEWNVTLPMILKQIEAKVMDKAAPDYLKKYGYKNWIDAFGSYLTWRRMVEMSRVHDEAFSEEVEKYNERVALKEKWVRDGKKGEAPKVGKKPVYKPYKLPYDFTISELEMLINQAPEQFKKAAKMYYLLNDNVLTILEDAGIISEDVHELLNKKYKEYCPLMRDFSDTAAADMFFSGLSNGGRGIGNVSSTLKSISLEGSERGVINPLESTVKAVAIAMNRAERNKVAQHAVEMAQKAGAKDIIWEYDVPKGSNPVADPKNCVFTVMYDGKKIAYQTRQELYAPIVGYNLPAVGMFLGVAKNAARTLRAGATMSPSFMVRNVLRDTIFAGISSKNGFTPLVDTLRGAIALLKDEKLRAEFETAGVTSFNFYNNPDKIYKSLVELNGGKQLSLAHPIELVKAIAQYFEDKSAFLESATRMGEFKRAREAGKSIDEAARAARELTLDFSRSGVVGENINQYVPFFNATLQGGDKLYRLFREDFTGTTVKVFKYIVLPSFLLWCLNHDEEWYKELDPKVKMTHWCLPNGIRIPKPQEAGVLFGSGIEAMLDLATGKDPEAMKNLARQIKDGALPNIIPTVLLPLVEWQANYSFFRDGKLVGYREEKLPDELQFKDSTSELSKAIGKGVGLSPIKIDNTVRGYTGTMGMFIWQLYDIGSINKEKLPDKKITELPFIRDFFVNDYNTRRSIDDFYKMAEEANKQHAGYGKKGKPSSVVKGIRAANKKISDLNKDIREITNKNIPSDRKRILIDRKRELQQRIAKNAITRYGRFFD